VGNLGRRTALAVGAALQLVFLASSAGWVAWIQSYAPQVRPPLAVSVVFVALSSIVYGFAEGTFATYVPATLQTFFSEGPFASCGNAAFRVYMALGFAIQASVSAAMSGRFVAEQHAVLLALSVVSNISLLYLHLRVSSVDGEKKECSATTTHNEKAIPIATDAEKATTYDGGSVAPSSSGAHIKSCTPSVSVPPTNNFTACSAQVNDNAALLATDSNLSDYSLIGLANSCGDAKE
jgi:hypothetical protein